MLENKPNQSFKVSIFKWVEKVVIWKIIEKKMINLFSNKEDSIRYLLYAVKQKFEDLFWTQSQYRVYLHCKSTIIEYLKSFGLHISLYAKKILCRVKVLK